MKALFIGGTGILSSASAARAVEKGFEITMLNRGKSLRKPPTQAKILQADINDTQAVQAVLGDQHFDVVVDWIAYTPEHVQRDLNMFAGKTGQYIFISSASAYQTPPSNIPFRESTPLQNPFWEYSRNKIACEELLINEYRKNKFPFTVVRPSHTYDRFVVPAEGNYTVLDRMLKGKPIMVHGDGTSIWTLTHNTDFAKGFVGLMGNSHAIGETFHITSDEWLTWNQIYKILGKTLGVDPQLVHVPSELIAAYHFEIGSSLLGDKAHTAIFDNSKIKQVVPEFSANVPFSLGAREIVEWHMADTSRQIIDTDFDALSDQVISNYLKAWPS
ncbi:MAG: SDR family oxidoreductase [Anaerolineaceae bacterium]|nr:SDR family oxidoreductase [Anaerolineaceae bacterium]